MGITTPLMFSTHDLDVVNPSLRLLTHPYLLPLLMLNPIPTQSNRLSLLALITSKLLSRQKSSIISFSKHFLDHALKIPFYKYRSHMISESPKFSGELGFTDRLNIYVSLQETVVKEVQVSMMFHETFI